MKIIQIMVFIYFLVLISCNNRSEDVQVDSLNYDKIDISDIFMKTIYFGHMSVGNNIIDGMEKILGQKEKKNLPIIRIDDVEEINGPGFYHSSIGKNGSPISKIKDFEDKIINQKLGEKIYIAFFKFCYVDIKRETDITKVFEKYVSTIENIQNVYPDLMIIHFTCPLKTHLQFGNLKASKIKRTMKNFARFGVNIFKGDQDNIRRNEYNSLIVEKYGDTDFVFDLSKYESMSDDGKLVSFNFKNKKYLCLNDDYTYDGGHLNEMGKSIIARRLIKYLNSVD